VRTDERFREQLRPLDEEVKARRESRFARLREVARDDVRRVVAVDSIRGDVDGVTWRILDVTDPALVSRFAGCDVVVHAAVEVGVTDDTAAHPPGG
jgi:nucleoside-diphosphate-sugar epimerase